MWSFAHLDKTTTLIQRKVPFHPLVCVKPNFVEATLDSEVVCEIEQSLSFPLRMSFHGDAVNKEVVGVYHKDSNSNRLVFSLQNPNLAPFDARPVILCYRFRDRSEHGHVGRDVGVRADAPNRVGIAGITHLILSEVVLLLPGLVSDRAPVLLSLSSPTMCEARVNVSYDGQEAAAPRGGDTSRISVVTGDGEAIFALQSARAA